MLFRKSHNNTAQNIKYLEEEISKLKSDVKELTILNEIAVSAGGKMELDQLIDLIVKKSIQATNAEQGSIILVSLEKDSSFNTLIRREAETQMMTSYKVGNYLIGWVLKNQKPLMIENLSKDERFKTTEKEEKEIRAVICLPIWLNGKIIAVFTLTNKKNGESFNSNDQRLASIISSQSAQLIHNLHLHEKIIEKERLDQELELARKIQMNLLPSTNPRNNKFEITSFFSPADSVGGDYYDYFEIDENRLGIVVADVSGHGPSAALIMTMLKGILHSILRNYISAQKTVEELNSIFSNIAPEETFVTLVLVVFDFNKHELQFSNAGHHPILHFKSDNQKVELLYLKGCALNITDNSKYLQHEVEFKKNDIFCIYTDGIVEAENGNLELFGTERLIRLFRDSQENSAEKISNEITTKLKEFTKQNSQSDDIALLILKVKD